MKGYKIFNNDWTCNGFQYEVGKEYRHNGKIEVCEQGFHFCQKLEDCFNYYDSVSWNKIAEVEALGEVKTKQDKSVTNHIRIVKELKFKDIDTVNESYGINWSYGINGSYGVYNSLGVDRALFLTDKQSKPTIFGIEVSDERFDEVMSIIQSFNWKPTFNNLKTLYLKSDSKWEETPIPNAKELSIKEAWSDMPKEMLEYIKSLPEFNKDMFYKITQIEVE